MRGGAALIFLALAGCLPAGEAPATRASASQTGLPAMYQGASLAEQGSPAVRGRLSGRCADVVIEAGTSNQARPLTATRAAGRTFSLPVPAGVPITLRWGCDEDGDGRVAPDALATAELGELLRDLPVDLYVPDPAAPAWDLVAPRERRPGFTPGAPSPTAGMAPPDAPAPADGAVGPPLPEGPPPGVVPPPTGAPPAP